MERMCPTCNTTGKGRFCNSCGKPLVVAAMPATGGTTTSATNAPDTEPTFTFKQVGVCDCGEFQIKKDGSCKNCGTVRIVKCPLCEEGTDKITPDGSCQCGNRRLPKPSDHDELVLSPKFASVCDRGIRHDYQQDRHKIESVPIDSTFASIFCIADGVSGSSAGGDAAEAAVNAACTTASNSLAHGMSASDCIIAGIRAAQDAVLRILWKPTSAQDQSPCATILVGIKIDSKLTWGWLGDTRLGWVTDQKCGWLVTDDSWINAERKMGVSEEAIRVALTKDRKLSRAVVRSLGSAQGEPSKLQPNVQSCDVPIGCTLVGCTDGFHVYADSPEQFASVVRKQNGGSALKVARGLVEFAKASGGGDNITVTVLTN